MIKNKSKIDEILNRFKDKKGSLIPVMQQAQEVEGYLSKDLVKYIAEATNHRTAKIFGVATFYSMFRLKPQGEHIIRICKGTACHVSNANDILDAIRGALNLKEGEDTTEDRKFTVMEVACLGCCSLAPVIMIDTDTHGKLTPDKVRTIIKDY